MMTREEATLLVGSALPGAVDSLLQRRWLDAGSDLAANLKPRLAAFEGEAHSMRLVKMGEPEKRDWTKLAVALRRALMACHRPGILRLGYRLDSEADGTTDIRFALRSAREGGGIGAEEYLANFTDVLSAELPGTAFESDGEDAEISQRKFFAPVTGIPGDGNDVGPFVAQLLAGMAGRPFSLLVDAEAVDGKEIDAALHVCREMLSQIEMLKSVSVSKGRNWTEQVSRQLSRSFGTTESRGTSSSSKGRIATAAAAAGAIAVTVLTQEPAAGGLIMMGSGALTPQRTETSGTSVTDTLSESFSQSLSAGASESATVNVVNAHAEAAANRLKMFAERLERAKTFGAWKVSVCLMTNSSGDLDRGKMLLKSLQTGEYSANEPIRTPSIPSPGHDLTTLQQALARWSVPEWRIVRKIPGGLEEVLNPLGRAFSGLSTPLSSCELANWLGMPHENMRGIDVVPYISGFSLAHTSASSENSIRLGEIRIGGGKLPFGLEVDSLTRHALLCGTTRSGKSTTAARILDEIRRIRGKDFPMLIIEPKKTEHLEYALDKNRTEQAGINVYMPGRTEWKGQPLGTLRLNPFEVVRAKGVKHVDVPLHIKYLSAIINAALPMQESLPILMESAVYACYGEPTYPAPSTGGRRMPAQWIPIRGQSREPEEGTPFPTFATLLDFAPKIVARLKYHQDANQGFIAALRGRIRHFMLPGMPLTEVFQGDGKPVDGFWDNLFSRPTVINLSAIPTEEDQAFFMAVMLANLYEWRRQEAERTGYTNALRHLLVVEEAHSVMRKSGERGMNSMDAAGKAAKMFADILAEIGAYGQGILIVDQSPGTLIDDAVKNTNTKIVHKLLMEDDIRQMAKALNLLDDQQRAIPSLAQGEAIVRTDDDDKPSRVRIIRS